MSVAFLIVYGPEVRAFIHSGLLDQVSQKYGVAIVTANPESAAFAQLDNVSIIPMPATSANAQLAMLRHYARVAQERWLLYKSGRKRWRHAIGRELPNNSKTNVLKQLLWFFLSWVLRKAELVAGKLWGSEPSWKRLLVQNSIDVLVCASYSAPRVLPALQTASNLNLKTVVALNSWKDTFVNPHLSVVPDDILVWSTTAATDLLEANPLLSSERVVVAPSLHLQNLMEFQKMKSREGLCDELGLQPNRPFICYTAAAPTATVSEEDIVESILIAIRSGQLALHPQLLLRLNPMEDGSRFEKLIKQYADDLVIQKPRWEWDAAKDWCCALADDMALWQSIIFYALFNVSIPSTVTLEFLALDRPVINVCFDANAGQPEVKSNRRFWEAEFYSDLREVEYVTPTFSREDIHNAYSRISSHTSES